MVRIVVDRGRCSGMGVCESIAPDRFEVGDDGVMAVLQERPVTLRALAAVRSCPAASLSLVHGPADAEVPLAAGSAVTRLTWGVKTSFVCYVRAVGGGVVADRGARDDGAAFAFAAAGSSPTDLEWRFQGRVSFQAHDGLLDVQIADPWVRLGDHGFDLSVTDGGGSRLTVGRGSSDVPLGTPVPVDLVAGAEHVFGSTYPSGTPLAHVLVSGPEPLDPA